MARGATVQKADNTASLSSSGSWTGGAVPGSFDFAQWDATVSGSNSVAVGGNLALGQLTILNPGGPVTLNASQTGTLTLNGVGGIGIDMSAATQNLTIACPINLGGGQTWSVGANTTLTVSGPISGQFGLTITGSGTTVLSGDLSGMASTTLIGGTLKPTRSLVFPFSGSGPVAIMPGATLDLNGVSVSALSLSIGGAGVDGMGVIVNNAQSSSGLLGANIINLLCDAALGGTSEWSLGRKVTGNGYSLTKIGSNAITFDQATVAGVKDIRINEGAIDIFSSTIDNAQPGSIYLNGNATLAVDSQVSNAKPIVFAGGAVQCLGFTNATFSGSISLNSTGRFSLSVSTLTLAGAICDGNTPNGIVLTGTGGTLALAGTNTFTGNTTLRAGTLLLNSPRALQNSTLDTSGNGSVSFGTLAAATLGGLTSSGTMSLSNGSRTAVALSVGNNNADTTYSGALNGPGSLTKIGSGALTLAGVNTYTGSTAINQGALVVNGSLASPVTLNSGGILSGTGRLTSVIVSAGGQLAPGDAPGAMLISGSLALLPGAQLDFDLATPGVSDEVLMPVGTLILDGQQFADFNFTPLTGFGPGDYTLINAGSVTGGLGAITSGTIDGLPATLVVQDNKNLVLDVVPEPSSAALLAALALGAFGAFLARSGAGKSRGYRFR